MGQARRKGEIIDEKHVFQRHILEIFKEDHEKKGAQSDHRCVACGGVFNGRECIECGRTI